MTHDLALLIYNKMERSRFERFTLARIVSDLNERLLARYHQSMRARGLERMPTAKSGFVECIGPGCPIC